MTNHMTSFAYSGIAFKYFFVSCEHWHQSDLSLEIISLFSLHSLSVVRSEVCIALRMSGREAPCIVIIMSSAKTTILTFASLESSFIRSLMIILLKVGPETGPWGQPLVTRFELRQFPTVTWAGRSPKKSFTMLNMLWGHFSFLSRAWIPSCQALL